MYNEILKELDQKIAEVDTYSAMQKTIVGQAYLDLDQAAKDCYTQAINALIPLFKRMENWGIMTKTSLVRLEYYTGEGWFAMVADANIYKCTYRSETIFKESGFDQQFINHSYELYKKNLNLDPKCANSFLYTYNEERFIAGLSKFFEETIDRYFKELKQAEEKAKIKLLKMQEILK